VEAGADDLLAGDPNISALRRLLYRLRALSCSVDLCRTGEEGSGVIGSCARGAAGAERGGGSFVEISRRGRRSRLKRRGCEPPPDGGRALPLPPSPFI